MVWERTTPNVLTMEYAPGVKINRIGELQRLGVDRKLLARRAVESYLQQLLTHGFFHADPHPGVCALNASFGVHLGRSSFAAPTVHKQYDADGFKLRQGLAVISQCAGVCLSIHYVIKRCILRP